MKCRTKKSCKIETQRLFTDIAMDGKTNKSVDIHMTIKTLKALQCASAVEDLHATGYSTQTKIDQIKLVHADRTRMGRHSNNIFQITANGRYIFERHGLMSKAKRMQLLVSVLDGICRVYLDVLGNDMWLQESNEELSTWD